MSKADRDRKRLFKKQLDAPYTDDESCAPLQMDELLSAIKEISIFNSYFSLDHCSRIWRIAIIIALLKAGKSPNEVASFCPISLVLTTSGKDSVDCFYYIAETKKLFSQFQGGFPKSQSCEDSPIQQSPRYG